MSRHAVRLSCLHHVSQPPRSSPRCLRPQRSAALRVSNAAACLQPFSTSPRLADAAPKTRLPPAKNDPLTSIASTLRTKLRSTTEPYVAFGGTEDLFQECNRQCTYTIPSALATPRTPPPKTAAGEDLGEGQGWWLESQARGGLGLNATFNTWAQVMFLHMWLLTVRLRCFPEKYVRDWHQHLLDHFFYAAEDRMATWHGMAARGVRNKHLKDLWEQWMGARLSYDEGLIQGDAVMATAVWRNIFKADPSVDMSALAAVTAYTMRELQTLARLDDAQIAEGSVTFGDPRSLSTQNLLKPNPAMQQKPTVQELGDAKEAQQ